MSQEKNLVACCGSYCALCPRYQSAAKSRCPGCKVISLTISCAIFNCCVKQKGFITCAECHDFPCEKNNPEVFRWDTFVTRRVYVPNINRIKRVGLRKWLQEQNQRRMLLEQLLANFNEGRSRTFYCTAAALMPLGLLRGAVAEARKEIASKGVGDWDIKARAEILRAIIENVASEHSVELKLRRKPK